MEKITKLGLEEHVFVDGLEIELTGDRTIPLYFRKSSFLVIHLKQMIVDHI